MEKAKNTTTLKEFENQAKNVKLWVDRLNKAYYGYTMEEVILSDRRTVRERDNEDTEQEGR